MKENNNGKEILKLLQENYEINTAKDLSSALKDMFKGALQEMMNAEFDSSMGYSKYDKKTEKTNYRNGSTKKNLKSEFGSFEFETPRDRNGEFEPKIVPKNTRDVSGIEDKIISLYAKGLTTRDINEQIQELYGIEVSATMVSNITDQIIPEIKEWQERPLDDVYPFVFIDAVHFSVREDNHIVKKAAYIVLGVNSEGFKEVLGIWIGENESAKYWLGVLNEKDLREFTNDLKKIYTSVDEEKGYEQLQEAKNKWSDKYSSAFKTWEENWDAICPFFQFSEHIIKIMYTTNTIESLNRQFRKFTKTKSVFPTDMALLKCLYLATKNISKKWDQAYRNWGPILSELSIMFDGRI